VSFSAHATADTKARKRLDELIDAILRHDAELVSIDAAIQEAKARLVAAQQAAAAAKERDRALELRSLLPRFVGHAKKLDELLDQIVTEAVGLNDTLNDVHRLGAAFPNHSQLDAIGDRALRTAILQTPWARSVENLAPGERRRFFGSISDWADKIERDSVQPRLNEKKKEAA
jgi:hypothetical protein